MARWAVVYPPAVCCWLGTAGVCAVVVFVLSYVVLPVQESNFTLDFGREPVADDFCQPRRTAICNMTRSSISKEVICYDELQECSKKRIWERLVTRETKTCRIKADGKLCEYRHSAPISILVAATMLIVFLAVYCCFKADYQRGIRGILGD